MYEQLDDGLKKRIGEVFENMELPTAEEGWLLLREKFPAKQKKLFCIPMTNSLLKKACRGSKKKKSTCRPTQK